MEEVVGEAAQPVLLLMRHGCALARARNSINFHTRMRHVHTATRWFGQAWPFYCHVYPVVGSVSSAARLY